jgi:hypothetical protein
MDKSIVWVGYEKAMNYDSEQLRAMGYNITAYNNLDDAIKGMEKTKYGLVILSDSSVVHETGIPLALKKIDNIDGYANIPKIITTYGIETFIENIPKDVHIINLWDNGPKHSNGLAELVEKLK